MGDESTWGFSGYMADAGGRLMNKPVGKGGQTTMIYDVSRRYPRAYVHWHKVHVRPVGFTAEGKFEIKNLIDQLNKLVVGRVASEELKTSVPPPSGYGEPTTCRKRCIYPRPPHITCDNHVLASHRHVVGTDIPRDKRSTCIMRWLMPAMHGPKQCGSRIRSLW